MKKHIMAALAVFCCLMLIFTLAGCGGERGASKVISDPVVSDVQEESAENIYPQFELGEDMYYVETFTPESDPGENPSALDCAKMIGAAILWTDLPQQAKGHNIYIALTGLERVNEADAYVYAISIGPVFDPQESANLYYLAADYAGNIYSRLDHGFGSWQKLPNRDMLGDEFVALPKAHPGDLEMPRQ